ncbi:MAG: 4Fe-4S binding protein [Candidatus Omnitrophota bacterium]
MTKEVKKLKLMIDKERCKGCLLCINVCPQKALGLSTAVNKKGNRYVILKHPDKCTCCGLCAIICPDTAIEIAEEK